MLILWIIVAGMVLSTTIQIVLDVRGEKTVFGLR